MWRDDTFKVRKFEVVELAQIQISKIKCFPQLVSTHIVH